MSRLTDKDCWKYEDFVFNYQNRETIQSGTDFAMYVKLKSLEDLEEKIGKKNNPNLILWVFSHMNIIKHVESQGRKKIYKII